MGHLTRSYYRVPAKIEAKLSDSTGKEWAVIIRNLSYGGFLVQCPEELKKGSILRIDFTLPGFLIPFNIPVQVVGDYGNTESSASKKAQTGLKILEYTEKWHQKIPAWIEDQVHARSLRKKTCFMLTLTGIGFAVKAAATACGNQLFYGMISRFELWGILRWTAKVLSDPRLSLLLACLCCYCGWTILKPSANRRFLNWLFAVMIAGTLIFRVLVKTQLLWGGKSQQIIFAMDYLMAILACASLLLMLQAEKFFRHYDSLRDREMIAPPSFSKT